MQAIVTGIDRFIARRWADYALDLVIGSDPSMDRHLQLRTWLEQEIKGKESSRKTANQVNLLWLKKEDPYQILRDHAIETEISDKPNLRPALHLGMAINVFPIFREVCSVAGRLIQLQGACTRQETCFRVMEKYGNPTSVPRAVSRVFQTLEDWGLMQKNGKTYTASIIEIEEPHMVGWFLEALLFTKPGHQMALSDLSTLPEQLGVHLNSERNAIRENPHLFVVRDGTSVERVGLVVS